MTEKGTPSCKWSRRVEVKLLPDENEAPPSFLTLLGKAITPVLSIAGFVGVLILSFGWSYAWHWFAQWGVPFASLELGADLLFEYGRLVIVYFWWLALLWIVVFSGSALAFYRFSAKPIWLALLIVFAFVVPWLFSHQLGALRAAAAAKEQQASNFAGWPEVHLIFNGEVADALPEGIQAEMSTGPNLCYRLLFRATDGLWLAKIESSGLPSATVFIANDAITYLRLRDPRGGFC